MTYLAARVHSIESKYRDFGLKGIDSEAEGLAYLMDNDRCGIALMTNKGMVGLTARQAKAVATELKDILELMEIR